MFRIALRAGLLLALLPVTILAATPELRHAPLRPGRPGVIHGGFPGAAKAARDTILMIGPNGSGAPVIGTFEDANGNADWNGWTHADLTFRGDSHWQASTYYAVGGLYSAWCGEDLPSCGAGDPAGGYANNYDQMLEWRGAVADPGQGCQVTVTATVQHDTEPGYDYTYVSYETAGGGIIDLVSWDGAGVEAVDETFSYAPGDYVGDGGNEVAVMFRVTTDPGWSDSDCSWPSHGACQVDDVAIALSNGTGYATDFEDGTLGAFHPRFPVSVGDFAQLWTGLDDLDPCHTNPSPQAAFIDDGVVVPGTGGTPCVNWCYGPGGYIVNNTGGLLGPDAHIDNAIESPVCAWPDPALDGATFTFDAYVHEEYSADAPGMFVEWSVRSAGPGEDITLQSWYTDVVASFADPAYVRGGPGPVGARLKAGRTQVQVRLLVYELGWIHGFRGVDGTPAPYFDNVRLAAYAVEGPAMSARTEHLAQDGFPADGVLDLADLGANSVRFDMAQNIAPATHLRNDPGDSVVVSIAPGRTGAELTGRPRMHYKLFANPVFDAYRTSGLPDEGFVLCDSVRYGTGQWKVGTWSADLPDTGFLFPGDVLHTFFAASDTRFGVVQAGLLPADTTGFSRNDPYDAGGYDPAFTVRALPSLDAGLAQPPVLFWNDVRGLGGDDEWAYALHALGLARGRDYDLFANVNQAWYVAGNGLGGRATASQLAGYDDLLYTSGDQVALTIANGDYDGDPSRDAQVLDAWLRSGGKDLFATGDHLAFDLQRSGAATTAFLADQLGLVYGADDLRPLIDGQVRPRVLVEPANPVFSTVSSWFADGGCPGLRTFDAVTPAAGAVRLAQFAGAGGAPGGYPYAAAVLNRTAWGARVISLPCGLDVVATDPDEGVKTAARQPARVRLLGDVLAYFGVSGSGEPTGVPGAPGLALRCAPNPCNPRTVVSFTAPRPGRLRLQLFDVRGRLVRTLVDGPVLAGPTALVWDGTDDGGRALASGLYFAQARFGADVRVQKVTLLK